MEYEVLDRIEQNDKIENAHTRRRDKSSHQDWLDEPRDVPLKISFEVTF